MPRIHWTFPAAALCLVGAIVSGCALLQPASPTTVVTDASGHESTLSWADFPGEPGVDSTEVLAAPRAEEVAPIGDALLDDLQRALDALAPGLDWRTGEPGGVFEHDGNGYGGPTMHRTYNSAERSTTRVPDDWAALETALDAELAAHGFDPVVWDFERPPYPHQTEAERDAEIVGTHGSLEPDEMWMWLGTASDGAAWVSVVLSDVDRGVSAPAGAEQPSPQLLSLMAGATVIAAADEQAYRDGITPFEGLARPESTHSD